MNSFPAAAAGVLALLVMVSGFLSSDSSGGPDVPASATVVSSPDEVRAVFRAGLKGVTLREQTIVASGGDTVFINDGCNTGRGVISIDDRGNFSTPGFAVTRMACPGKAMVAAADFHRVVAHGAVLVKDGGTYWISGDNGALQFAPGR